MPHTSKERVLKLKVLLIVLNNIMKMCFALIFLIERADYTQADSKTLQ